MIPQRVAVKGFLSYREEQEVCFDESGALWMLAGPNGSGKSSIFDAVTFALFGQHRGGRHNAKELVNKQSDGFTVEFDFLLEGRRYQARRTLRKQSNRSTRQINRWDAAAAAWEAIPDTNYEDGFAGWVREHIGLNYETFTSSVLLLQGKADKLLAAAPAERFGVLAGIVDLGRYEQLFRRADDQRRCFEALAESLQQQRTALPEVGEAEFVAANQRVETAETDCERAAAEVERFQHLALQAERWAELQGRLAEVDRQWERAEIVLEQAAAIERDWERLSTLRTVLPHVESMIRNRVRRAESVALSAGLRTARQVHAERLDAIDADLEQTRQKRAARRQRIEADEAEERALGSRLRELSGILARAALCERQRQELGRLEEERARLPADPRGLMEQAQQEYDRLAAASLALPLLRRLRDERIGLQQACARQHAAALAEDESTVMVAAATESLGQQSRQTEIATHAHQHARDRATEARTRRAEAQEQLREFSELEGAKTCRACAQPIQPGHYELETARRQTELAIAEDAFRRSERDQQVAAQEERRLLGLKSQAEHQLRAATDALREHRQHAALAVQDAQRHRRECQLAHQNLAEPFRTRVAPSAPDDWRCVLYPTAEDLQALQHQAGELEATRGPLRAARETYEAWTALAARIAAVQQALAAQERDLPQELTTLQEEAVRSEAEDHAVKARLATQRQEARADQDFLDRQTVERQRLAQQLANLDRQQDEQTVRQQEAQAALDQARTFLPAEWQGRADAAAPSDLPPWQTERAELEQRRVEAQAKELREVCASLELLRQRKADLERDAQEISPESRRDPAELRTLITEAKQARSRQETILGHAREEERQLHARRQARADLEEQFRAADRQQTHSRTLVEHLGRKGLQLHLVRQAERGILDFANAILDRLSAGRFYLHLRGEGNEEADRALELEVTDRHRNQVLGLPFLSGSQRFRVAVSLALGIGQYASRRHHPIESVIIDEGFGCLDKEGRQVMIQELQNLRSQLRCILLVSHQEEFADAFADGYRFELIDGSTRVERFQR